MSSLKAVAQLEFNVPGCIISIRIPSAEIAKLHSEKAIVDINCKHFFNKLCKPAIQPMQPCIPGAETIESGSTLPPVNNLTKITNRYDNIIDQLERKYYGECMVQANKDAENSSEDDSDEAGDEVGDVAEMEDPVPAKEKSKSKPNKKKIFSDDYDMEDPFIDDQEMITEVEASLKTSRTKTKHDGFFVSSGKLEVFSPKKMQKTSHQAPAKNAPAASRKDAPPTIPEIEVDDTAPPEKAGESSEVKKKRKRRTKKELEEAAAAAAAGVPVGKSNLLPTIPPLEPTKASEEPSIRAQPTPVDTVQISSVNTAVSVNGATGSAGEGVETTGSPDGAVTFATKARVEKVLPPWSPSQEILQALDAYKNFYEQSGIKLFKSSNIPKKLEEPLREVDRVVLRSINADSLQRTTGFFEGLHAIMGGELQIGKIRSLMVRLRLRDRAAATLQGIEAEVDSLVEDLKKVVVPCPERMQPAHKAAKKAQAQSKTGGGEAAKDDDDEAQNEDEDAKGGGGGSEESHKAPPTQTAQSTHPAAPPVSAADGGVPASPNAQSASGAGLPVHYEWICNWTRPMKVKLCAIEHSLKLWVLQENQYREKLTVHDKKYLHERDCVQLVEKDVVAAYLERICNIAMPPSCLQGTISYMRRVSTMLNKVPKDKNKEKVAVTASVVESVGSAIATQLQPEDENIIE